MKLSIPSLMLCFCVSSLSAQVTSSHKTPAICGRWNGTSICVDKATDRACNDEKVVYDFDTVKASPGKILQNAFRYSGTELVPMGDLTFAYIDSLRSWSADFTGRAHIRWTYYIEKGQLRGTCVELPSLRLIRRVEAVRDSSRSVK